MYDYVVSHSSRVCIRLYALSCTPYRLRPTACALPCAPYRVRPTVYALPCTPYRARHTSTTAVISVDRPIILFGQLSNLSTQCLNNKHQSIEFLAILLNSKWNATDIGRWNMLLCVSLNFSIQNCMPNSERQIVRFPSISEKVKQCWWSILYIRNVFSDVNIVTHIHVTKHAVDVSYCIAK